MSNSAANKFNLFAHFDSCRTQTMDAQAPGQLLSKAMAYHNRLDHHSALKYLELYLAKVPANFSALVYKFQNMRSLGLVKDCLELLPVLEERSSLPTVLMELATFYSCILQEHKFAIGKLIALLPLMLYSRQIEFLDKLFALDHLDLLPFTSDLGKIITECMDQKLNLKYLDLLGHSQTDPAPFVKSIIGTQILCIEWLDKSIAVLHGNADKTLWLSLHSHACYLVMRELQYENQPSVTTIARFKKYKDSFAYEFDSCHHYFVEATPDLDERIALRKELAASVEHFEACYIIYCQLSFKNSSFKDGDSLLVIQSLEHLANSMSHRPNGSITNGLLFSGPLRVSLLKNSLC